MLENVLKIFRPSYKNLYKTVSELVKRL